MKEVFASLFPEPPDRAEAQAARVAEPEDLAPYTGIQMRNQLATEAG